MQDHLETPYLVIWKTVILLLSFISCISSLNIFLKKYVKWGMVLKLTISAEVLILGNPLKNVAEEWNLFFLLAKCQVIGNVITKNRSRIMQVSHCQIGMATQKIAFIFSDKVACADHGICQVPGARQILSPSLRVRSHLLTFIYFWWSTNSVNVLIKY